MAAPRFINELTAVTSLSSAAAVHILQGGVDLRTTAGAFITQMDSFTQSGSATSRTVLAKLREVEVSITDYGAATSASASVNAAAIQEAHDDGLPSTGGTIKVPGAASVYSVALESVSFTKPVVLLGDGRDASILSFTGNAASADGINTTKSLFVRGVTLKPTSAPVTDLAMCGVRISNPATSGHTIVVDDSAITDFNFGVFADGRSVGGANFDLDFVAVTNSDLRISTAAGAVGEPVFIAGASIAVVEKNKLDNQNFGDHNVYAILVKNLTIRGNRMLNAYNDGFKIITEGAGATGTLESWTVEDNTVTVCGRFGSIGPSGSVVVEKVSIKGNAFIDSNTTTGADAAGVYISPVGTSVIRSLELDNTISDVQLAGYVVTPATGAEVSVLRIGGEVRDFSKSSSGTYDAISSGSLGTMRLAIFNGFLADGNSTGRDAYNFDTFQHVYGEETVKEINCVTPRTYHPVLALKVTLFDDFLGDVLADQWNSRVGSDPQVVAPAILAGQQRGVMQMTTGDDAAANMAVNGVQLEFGLHWKADQEKLVVEARVNTGGAATLVMFFGFTDQVAALEMPFTYSGTTLTSNAADAVGVLFDTDATVDNWKLVGVANNVDATVQDAGSAPSGDVFETWRIEVSSAGAATFFRNGNAVGSVMTGAVTPTVALTPVLAAFSNAATSRTVNCDYIAVQSDR